MSDLHSYSNFSTVSPEAVISGSDQVGREEEKAEQEEQQARADGSGVVGWGQSAVVIGLQTGSVSNDMGDVALLLDTVEEVRHGTFGKDGYILYAMGLWIQRDWSLLTVIFTRWSVVGQRRSTSDKLRTYHEYIEG